MSNIFIPGRHQAAAQTQSAPPPEILTVDGMLTANEMMLAKRAGELLEREYPGHQWFVGINQGCMDIKPTLGVFTGNLYYTIKFLDSYSSSDLDKKVRQAGGAWLEILRQKRGAANADALMSLRSDVAGVHRPEM